jgi:hypothetical protein
MLFIISLVVWRKVEKELAYIALGSLGSFAKLEDKLSSG